MTAPKPLAVAGLQESIAPVPKVTGIRTALFEMSGEEEEEAPEE